MDREKTRTDAEKVKNAELNKEMARLRDNLIKREKEVREMKVDVERWGIENQEMTKKYKEWQIQKAQHDEQYYEMKSKFDGMRTSLVEKDEWILKISKELGTVWVLTLRAKGEGARTGQEPENKFQKGSNLG